MAMTISQLERYMIFEVENLHLKIDSAFEMLSAQIKDLADRMDRGFAGVNARLDNHERRLISLEQKP